MSGFPSCAPTKTATIISGQENDDEDERRKILRNSTPGMIYSISQRPFPLSVAPMIQWTDRNWRFMMRQITRETLLYSEMIPADAVVYANGRGAVENFVGYSRGVEEPLAIQLGGSDPHFVSEAALIAESVGNFEEINLNCGCPSNKAKKCGYGAELMLDPELVRELLTATSRKVTRTQLSVKCRLGLDRTGYNEWSHLVKFVNAVRDAGVRKMIIHSRICVLNGLSCAQNRTVPPLRSEACHKLVKDFPDMQFVINGGVDSIDEALFHLGRKDNFPKFDQKILKNMKNSVEAPRRAPVVAYTSDAGTAGTSNNNGGDDVSTLLLSSPSLAEEIDSSCFAHEEDTDDKDAGTYVSSSSSSSGSGGCGDDEDDESSSSSSASAFELCSNDMSSRLYFDDAISLLSDHPVHGVMIGREVYHNPFILADADEVFYSKENQCKSRRQILDTYFDYCDKAQDSDVFGSNICTLLKPLHNFFHGASSNTMFKRKLDDLTKQMSKQLDVRVRDVVEAAIEGTMSSEILESWTTLKT